MKEGVIREYAKILRKYMTAFSLEAIDIAYLAKSIKRTINFVLEEKGSLELETQEAIARIFGLRYFEFGNPKHPLPSLKSLPESTKKRIEYRKKAGPSVVISYNTSDINARIKEVLSRYSLGDQFLAKEIASKILDSYGERYSVSEVIDRLKKRFKDNIVRTTKKDMSSAVRGPKPVYYELVREVL
jgi:hypothetical protein